MRICKFCGASESTAKWVTRKGNSVGLVCLSCTAKNASLKRLDPTYRELTNTRTKLCNQAKRNTVEGRANYREYNKKYSAARRKCPIELEKSRSYSRAWACKKLANPEYKQQRYKLHNARFKEKRLSDPAFAAKLRVKTLLYCALRGVGYLKSNAATSIFCCSYQELLQHLGCECGIPAGTSVDHFLPMALARTKENAKTLNHYTNLQLLSTADNLEKSDWIASIGCRARDLTDEQANLIVENFRKTL